MSKRLDTLRQYVDTFGKGLVREMAPEIAGGIIVELFKKWKVDTAKIVADVNNHRSLWTDLSEGHRNKLKKLSHQAGGLKWATPTWLISAIKHDFPAVASLFLGWPQAQEWLIKQLEALKKEIQEE